MAELVLGLCKGNKIKPKTILLFSFAVKLWL